MNAKIKDLRELSIEELDRKEKSIKKDLFDLRNQAGTGTVEKPDQIRELKRSVARIKTIIKEKLNDKRN